MGAGMSNNSDPPRSESSTAIPLKTFSPKNHHLRASKSVMNIKGEQKDPNNGFLRNSFINSISMKKLSLHSEDKEKESSTQAFNAPQNEESHGKVAFRSATSTQRLSLEDAKNNNNNYKESFSAKLRGNSSELSHNLMKSSSCYTLINERHSQHHNSFYQQNNHYRGSSMSPASPHLHRKNNNHLRYSRSIDSMMSSKKYVIHASTSELLKCLGYFLFYQCPRLEKFQPNAAVVWIRAIDRSLIMQGWAEIAFINPANVVFIFMLLKDFTHEEINSENQLQILTQTCLYISYAYMGNEISYPLAPFILEEDRDAFWSRCLDIINKKSGDMLKLNSDPVYFTEIFTELKSYTQNFS